ncbi:MAG: radical SAM/SPASM domain-containing protein [Candidatus Coproplasma sp.]
MIINLNDNVVLVTGMNRAAIYDFNNNKIYSVNQDTKDFLLRYIKSHSTNTLEEKTYIDNLEQKSLLKKEYEFKEYCPINRDKKQISFVWLEITQTCNLRCIHCYEGNTHKSCENSLSTNEWKRIIKELSEVNCPQIQFIGGEPSCHNDLIELINYAGKFDFKSVGLFTNATLISDSLLYTLKNNKVRVNVSLYGHTPEVHDAITTVKGSFENALSNIRRMQKAGIQVNIAITLMKENEQYFEDIISFVKNLGVNSFKYDLVREVCGCEQSCHLVERAELIEKKYRTKPNFSISKEWFDNSFYRNTCWYGKFAITENGDVLPCIFERNLSYGNLRETSVSHILDSKVLSECWFMDYSKIEECSKCEYRFACKDCRPLGQINGGLYKKSIRCKYRPLSGEWE